MSADEELEDRLDDVVEAAFVHADRAVELLRGLDAAERELADLSPERELELVAAGVIKRLNANREWTAELATAHALASIAASLYELAGR